MNQITDNYKEILEFAKSYGLPVTKKRAILREYLQSKILSIIYQDRISVNLYFAGGTSLRLLRGMDRFSEDLDFDINKSYKNKISGLTAGILGQFKRENIKADLYKNITQRREYYEIRFPDLLNQLKISSERQEKLAIKLDFEYFWQGMEREVVLFNRYGFLTNIVTAPLSQILVQKLYAYPERKQTLGRDIYDVIWLAGHRAKIDEGFARKNKINPRQLLDAAEKKFSDERGKLKSLKNKLRPFLIDEKKINNIDLFTEIIKSLKNS